MVDEKHADVSGLTHLDRTIHEPGRLATMAILYVAVRADFLYLQRETGLTRGNLSAHLSKLESEGYIEIEKIFEGKKPRTLCKMTPAGRTAFDEYIAQIKGMINEIE